MSRSNAVKMVVALVCLAGSAAAIYNVQSDVTPLQERAEELACGTQGCARLLGLQRVPTSQTFTFQISDQSAGTKIIECTRSFLLFGEYTCKALN